MPFVEAWLSLVERCVREHRTVGARRKAVCCIFPLTLHRHGVFISLKFRSKILLTTCLTTSVENSYFEAWLSLVERCVREHRTVGAPCRAVCCILPLTLHRYGDFVGRKSWSKISLTTYLTTYNKFGVKKSIIETWLSLVERCVRDAEVACSNHVVSTTQTALLSHLGLSERFNFYICRNILLPHLQSCRFGSFEGCTVLVQRFFSPPYSLFYAAYFLNSTAGGIYEYIC